MEKLTAYIQIKRSIKLAENIADLQNCSALMMNFKANFKDNRILNILYTIYGNAVLRLNVLVEY